MNFHLQMEACEKNVIIFRADMSSFVHIDNENKNIEFKKTRIR